MSKLKAELVRNNIVTRANLMKLYQPPVNKNSGIKFTPGPKQNPWYNGEIVTQSQISAQSSRYLEREVAANLFGK